MSSTSTLPILREDDHGVIPYAGSPSSTLVEAESFLAEMLDTEGAVDPAIADEFRQVLHEALKTAVEKRDRVGQFILQLKARAKACREEAQRVTARARVLENADERVRGYVLNFIESLPLDSKGKMPKLEGKTVMMSARALPKAAEVVDEAAVPLEYKTVNVSMPAQMWRDLLEGAGGYLPQLALLQANYSIDGKAIKDALSPEGASPIPGVDVIVGRYTLQVK